MMVAMIVKRSLAAISIIGLFMPCEGQPMMRKRVVSPAIEVEGLKISSNASEKSPDFDTKTSKRDQDLNRINFAKEQKHNGDKYIQNRLLHVDGEKESGRINRKLLFGDSQSEEALEHFLTVMRMNGVQMSMPSPSSPTAPTRSPSNGGNASKKPAVVPSPSPAMNPTDPTTAPIPTQVPGCESLPREEVIKETLEKVTSPTILDDFSTPQGKAFAWIVGRDMAEIDPCDNVAIEQRYALATFHYSTNGGAWDESDGWLTDPNECVWIGIGCNANGLVTELGANGALVANNLSGVLPEEIKVLKALEVIQIGQNAIGGSIPDVLTEFPELVLFDVELNSFSGPPIVNLQGLNQLESYRVSANRFSGSIDPNIGDVTSLRELWMADNQISGTIPESFGKLVNIESLYMYRNNLSGNLPATFGQMKKLRELQLFQNFLSGTIPEGLYSNTELGLARLDRNQFTGTISESIGNLVKLADLRIDENLFTGKLPASFLNLSNLVVLRVNDNNFVGTIRDGFDLWKKLDFADFRNNGFDGTLPETIFNIPTLRILYFANNNLDGTLPSNYGSSPVLRDLFLSGNQLSGTIPDIQVGQLTKLTELLLEDNRFTGTMAESICNLRTAGQGILEDLWVDCGIKANPRLECDAPGCCTACFPSTP